MPAASHLDGEAAMKDDCGVDLITCEEPGCRRTREAVDEHDEGDGWACDRHAHRRSDEVDWEGERRDRELRRVEDAAEDDVEVSRG